MSVIDKMRQRGNEDVVLLDPFGGVGTAVLAAEQAGILAYGLEAQPFIARIARAKLLWHADVTGLRAFAGRVLANARSEARHLPEYPELVHKCYPNDTLSALHSLKNAWESLTDGSHASELTWLALTSILRMCSPVGTAPWQYVLPRKSKSQPIAPYDAFCIQVENMASDMTLWQIQGLRPSGTIIRSDARECSDIGSNITLVVTSPPYVNNYDYADATRLEMSFWGDVTGWSDLHQKARQWLVRSCSQHVSTERTKLEDVLGELSHVGFLAELEEVCHHLGAERMEHGGRKDYHVMVAAYFADMKRVWTSLRRVCSPRATVCFVIGDSAPYGVYVPVEKWQGELALAAGFRSYAFEKLRERNTKWKNRKHRVPLHEGRLWVEG